MSGRCRKTSKHPYQTGGSAQRLHPHMILFPRASGGCLSAESCFLSSRRVPTAFGRRSPVRCWCGSIRSAFVDALWLYNSEGAVLVFFLPFLALDGKLGRLDRAVDGAACTYLYPPPVSPGERRVSLNYRVDLGMLWFPVPEKGTQPIETIPCGGPEVVRLDGRAIEGTGSAGRIGVGCRQ